MLSLRFVAFLLLALCVWLTTTMWLFAFPAFTRCSDANRIYPRAASALEAAAAAAIRHNLTVTRDSPLIFVGGVPRSGTTLLRVMLDAHPDVRCGEETRIIPRLLFMKARWFADARERDRLNSAGVSENVVDDALAAFLLEVIAKHGEPARRLCNKDPLALKSIDYLSRVFPNAKFVMMYRDGRAVANSIVTRKVRIQGVNVDSFASALEFWNRAGTTMNDLCRKKPTVCYPLRYEDLVIYPKREMIRLLEFLDVRWNDTVLHHEKSIGQRGGASLSKCVLYSLHINSF